MRFIVLIAAVFLVSCATPKTAPQSYYSGVYSPGSVQIEENNAFLSKALVWEESDGAIARKSAFARLLLKAKEAGYRSFSIDGEKRTRGLGFGFTVRGKLFKSASAGRYPIDAIKRLLKDLPLEAPKPAYTPAPKKTVKKTVRKAAVRPKKAKVAAAVPIEAVEPVAQPTEAESEEPLVIMAPDDITTESIRTSGGRAKKSPAQMNPFPTGLGIGQELELKGSGATSQLPKGVLIRRQ